MSESDPRFHSKKPIEEAGTAIVPVGSDALNVFEEDYEQSEWTGGSSTEDKIGRAIELAESKEGIFLLPRGMSLADIQSWVPRAAKTLNKNKVFERKEGRTGLEIWAFPTNYANLEGSMGGGGGKESLEDVGSRIINIGELIYDEISIHGRETIDEICRNIEAIDPQLITVVVNTMLQDKFLQLWTEEDGLITLELVEAHQRNRSLGYTVDEDKPKELIDKESERNIGGTPDRPEDVIPIIDPEMEDLVKNVTVNEAGFFVPKPKFFEKKDDCLNRGHDAEDCPDDKL